MPQPICPHRSRRIVTDDPASTIECERTMNRLALALFGLAFSAAAADIGPDFNREVRPILSDNCFQCHGPDEKRRMANLRLDIPEGAFSESKRGKMIVPGDASKSLLYQRVSHPDTAWRMPPASTDKV